MLQVDGDAPPEQMDTSGLEVTSAFTANVWEVSTYRSSLH